MKKIKYITVLSMCAFITFSSCKKETENAPEINSQDQTTQKLIEFKNKLNSKDGSTLSIESANWHLEGLLNYEKANNDHNLTNISHFYDTLFFNFSSETINIGQLEVVYLNLNKKLNNHLQLIPNSKFDLIDLNFVSSNNETSIVMISSIGSESTKYIYQTFGSADYWRWGWNLGKCDGTMTGQDGADQLKNRFNTPLNKPYYPGYYTNVEMKTILPSSYPDPNYTGAFYNYMIFWAGGQGSGPGYNNEPCISPNDLNYYLSKFDYIKDLNCPTGKSFKNANVIEDISAGLNYWDRRHNYELYYGTFIREISSN